MADEGAQKRRIDWTPSAMGDLSFPIQENPPWRCTVQGGSLEEGSSVSSPLTSTEMIEKISERIDTYEKLPEKARKFCTTAFKQVMAIRYVHHSNVGESVGTQAFGDTLALLEDTLRNAGAPSDRREDQRESINTYHALKKFYDDVGEKMEITGFLTVQQLCDVHKVLLEDLHLDNGKIRDGYVASTTEDSNYFHPAPHRVKPLLYSLIDHHNFHMEYYRMEVQKGSTKEKVEFIVKCAARLLFDFVDVHPFFDGNGRMCRLLANYVVSLITPFPVSVYLPPRSYRSDYVDAIVKCRDNREEGPRDLAAMILAGIYLGWESLFEHLERLRLLEVGERLGPIVVKKSNLQSLEEKLRRACEGSTAVPEGVTEVIRCAITSTDVSSLRPLIEFKSVLVPIDKDREVIVNIYP